ncbi:MAG: M43 family zinc metalloprotease, partial [Bacteroidales bacterium]
NYWFAEASSYGYIRYEVVADTNVKAAIYEFPNDTIAVKASLIRKIKYSSFNREGVDDGGFIACRQGNKAYLMENRKKQWFKWIDMDALPGDKWLMIETNTSSQGVIDYVEVSYRDTLNMEGQKIPVIRMFPSCTSRFHSTNDFTSRIRMLGYYNIDYLSINNYPEAYANGMINYPLQDAMYMGLLCAQNGDKNLNTSFLKMYVSENNPWMYAKGIVECDSLQAPIWIKDTQNTVKKVPKCKLGMGEEVFTVSEKLFPLYEKREADYQRILLKSKISEDKGELLTVPVVVHIVYNPATPNEKISEAQVQTFLEEINAAYTSTQKDQVRTEFKDVVGNPNIKFVLATKNPQGEASTGIVYHTTTQDYFQLAGSEITQKYNFKFDSTGRSYNWDNQKYINIYVVDLGGMDTLTDIGGFVTEPLVSTPEQNEEMIQWLSNGKYTLWENWIKGKEAQQIDGLTVDTWYTFGGANASNPDATIKTAVHELGHYLGIRHPNIVLITGGEKTLLCDDGFEDTPWTHYTQYAETSCQNAVMQCGNLVQVENYMDYALPCACMFTKEQVAYMRTFLKDCRKNMGQAPIHNEKTALQKTIQIYPNPNHGDFYVQLDATWHTPQVSIYNVLGVQIPIFVSSNATSLHLSSDLLKRGLYILKVSENEKIETITFSVK